MATSGSNGLRALIAAACVAEGCHVAVAGFVPPPFPGTGPYRRVYSDTGASYLSVSVFLPGSAQVAMNGSDTAYVYVGGWGANGVNLTVQASGTQINGAGLVTQSLTLANVAGWSVGGQHTLKRMTSIAQVGGDNFTSGSRISGVAWTNAVIGLDAASATTWTGGGGQNYPVSPAVVSVNSIDAANETDSISLVPVPEPAGAPLLATVLGEGAAWSLQRRTRKLPADLFRSRAVRRAIPGA